MSDRQKASEGSGVSARRRAPRLPEKHNQTRTFHTQTRPLITFTNLDEQTARQIDPTPPTQNNHP
jgi:hypothetical protein